MTETESEDFWTATEDEHSTMEKVRMNKFLTIDPLHISQSLRLQPRPLMALKGRKGMKLSTSAAASPLVRSPLLLSSSSIGPPTPPTSSSCLYSDSDSFSSEGLGMPRMEDEALEDLAEQLHGCLEGSEGTLHFRGLEVARLAEGRLVRSFSDSFLAIGGDLDRLGSLASGVHVSEVRESLMRTNSAIGLAGEEWGPALGKDEPDCQWEGVWLEPMGSEEETQCVAILTWAAATLAGLPKATFNTQVEIQLRKLLSRRWCQGDSSNQGFYMRCYSFRAPHDYRDFQRWLTKLKNQNAGVSLSCTFLVTISNFVTNQLLIRVGNLLSLLLEYQETLVEEQKYQEGHMYHDMREKTRSDLFTFLCNKLEKHLLTFHLVCG